MMNSVSLVKYTMMMLTTVSVQCFAANILAFFSIPSISHQLVFRQLTRELAKRGHKLVVITPNPALQHDEVARNIIEIDVRNASYDLWQRELVANVNGDTSSYEIARIILTLFTDLVDLQINHEDFQNIINRRDKFDLILTEASVRPALIVSHIFKAPVIQVASHGSVFPNLNVIGAYYHPTLYPELSCVKIHDLTIVDKLKNIWHELKIRRLSQYLKHQENAMIAKNIRSGAPTVDDLNKNVEMLFLYLHPLWDNNRPVPPGLVYIGGLYQRPSVELPQDIAQYLNASSLGVIYVSFGTNVLPSLLPPTVIQVFMSVFSKLPYDILLKWDTEDIIGKPKNVKVFKWLPQPDILKHPNIKLFINQGGLQSSEEAITAEVPMISFPMLVDQWYNADKYVNLRIGLKHEIKNINEEELETSITTVINDSSYKQNIKKLRALMLDQPESPAERAVWWVEYVLRHGGARHLRSPLADASWTEYLMLDILGVLFLGITLCIALIFYVIRIAINLKRVSRKIKKC